MSRAAGPLVLLALALSAGACNREGGNNEAADARNAVATAQACTPPRPYWVQPGPLMGPGTTNRISLNHQGEIYWNDQRTDLAHITHYLTVVARMNPEPITFLQTEMGTSCALVDRIRDEMDRRLDCSHHGPCAEGVWTIWENTPPPPGSPVP